MPAIRTLGEFVADEQIITWLAEQIGQNHRDSDRGARAVAKKARLPMVCSTCTATKADGRIRASDEVLSYDGKPVKYEPCQGMKLF